MQDLAKLSKPQLVETLRQRDEQLAAQTKEVAAQNDVIQQLEAKIMQLENDYLKLWQERFRAKSERYIGNPDQLRIDFGDTAEAADAAEGLADAVEDANTVPESVDPEPPRRPPRKKRDESLPSHLPRQIVIIDVNEAEKQCDQHGEKTQLPEAMWDVIETLKYRPPELYIEVRKYPKYACANQAECGITTAERPTGLVEGDKYDATIAAEIITNKFAFHLPVYRQQDQFAGTGWTPSRSTLLNILTRGYFVILPLLHYFKRALQQDRHVACDDTTTTLLYPKIPPEFDRSDPKQKRIAEVFDEAAVENKSSINARMWGYRGITVPLNVFDFTVSRHRDGPELFFQDYHGRNNNENNNKTRYSSRELG
jgi:transposase